MGGFSFTDHSLGKTVTQVLTIAKLALIAVAASIVTAQEANKPRPRLELAQALREVDSAIKSLQAAQQSLAEAARLARAAEQHAKEVEAEQVVNQASALRARVDSIEDAVSLQARTLLDTRESAAAEAPATLLEGRDEILLAASAKTPEEAEVALNALEKQYTELDATDPKRATLLGFVRLQIGDTLRQRAAFYIRINNAVEGERILLRAARKYRDILSLTDFDAGSEGTSIHAAALLRVIQIEANLYQGYRDMAEKQPTGTTHLANARVHREAAERAFENIKRNYGKARTANGSLFVEVARNEATRIAR